MGASIWNPGSPIPAGFDAGVIGYSVDEIYPLQSLGRSLYAKGISANDAPFNAVGDGVTDDTAALQAALDFASAVGQPVRLLTGQSYLFSEQLIIGDNSGFISDGSASLLINTTAFTNTDPTAYETDISTALNFSGDVAFPYTPKYNQILQGVKVTSTSVIQGRALNIVSARNCYNLTIAYNEIYNFSYSKVLIVASLRGLCRIVGNNIHDIYSNVVFPLYPTFADRGQVNIDGLSKDDDCITDGTLITSDELVVVSNRFYNLNHGPVAIAVYGNQADAFYENKGNNLLFAFNTVDLTSEGFDSNGYDGRVIGNKISRCTEFGIKLMHGARRTKVLFNSVQKAGIAGVYCGVSDVVANGNTQKNVIKYNTIRDIDPDGINGGAGTACIKFQNTGTGGLVVTDNITGENTLDPGVNGEYVIWNNSAGDVRHLFDKDFIEAAGTVNVWALNAANQFNIIQRIPTRVVAYPSVATAIVTGTWTKATYNQEAVDANGEFDTSDNRWVCKDPGYYKFTVNLTLAACRLMYVALRKNGSTSEIAITPLLDFATDSAASGQLTYAENCVLGDYIEVWVQHGSGANRAIVAGLANSWFIVEKMA